MKGNCEEVRAEIVVFSILIFLFFCHLIYIDRYIDTHIHIYVHVHININIHAFMSVSVCAIVRVYIHIV